MLQYCSQSHKSPLPSSASAREVKKDTPNLSFEMFELLGCAKNESNRERSVLSEQSEQSRFDADSEVETFKAAGGNFQLS